MQQPSSEQTKAAIQKTLELVKSQKNFAKNDELETENKRGFSSIASTAGNLFKSLQTTFDLPDHEKVKEKLDEDKRARDLAAAISQASA